MARIAQGTAGGPGSITQKNSGNPGALRTPGTGSRFSSDARAENGLYLLSPRAIWGFLTRQPPSFWFACIYLFFEYVRPQQIYAPLQGVPYARATIILGLVSFLFERRKIHFRMPEFLLAIFSVIVLASSAAAFDPSTSYDKLPVFLSWMLIYVLIANTVDTSDRFLVFMLSFLLYSFKMSQGGLRSWAADGFAFRTWGTTGAPGWFQNSGEFGVQMCIFLPVLVAFILALKQHWPRWLQWFAWGVVGTAILGIVASSSRGALIGLAAVFLWAVLQSRRKFRALFAAVVLAGLVYAIIPPEQKLRLQTAGQDETSVSRTTMWKQGLEMMGDYPVLGIGYANWTKYHPIRYGGHGLLAHNVFIEAGSELGYGGLAVFVALIACTFSVNRNTRKIAIPLGDQGRFIWYMARGLDGALVGFIFSGFFISVLFYPFFWINLAMSVALHNAARKQQSEQSLPRSATATPNRDGFRPIIRAV